VSLEQVLIIALVGAFVATGLLLTAMRMAVAAEIRELHELGCHCEAGRDGFHLPGCPVGDQL
jgi:biotin operon repressor